MWIGSLLVITSMLTLVPNEDGAARDRMIVASRRLLRLSSNIGAIVAVAFGFFLILLNPTVMRAGWMHAKLGLVLVMIYLHFRLYRRIVALESNPGSATRGEFSMIHGAVSLLLLLILVLVLVKPF
jgi:putative membrane protein